MPLSGGVFGPGSAATNPVRGATCGILSGVLDGVCIVGMHRYWALAPKFIVATVAIGTIAPGAMTAVAGHGLGRLDSDLRWGGWTRWRSAGRPCGGRC